MAAVKISPPVDIGTHNRDQASERRRPVFSHGFNQVQSPFGDRPFDQTVFVRDPNRLVPACENRSRPVE